MNLLLIMPNFFDYPKQIKLELEKIGYNVDFFDDRPSTNSLVKAIIKINYDNRVKGFSNFCALYTLSVGFAKKFSIYSQNAQVF